MSARLDRGREGIRLQTNTRGPQATHNTIPEVSSDLLRYLELHFPNRLPPECPDPGLATLPSFIGHAASRTWSSTSATSTANSRSPIGSISEPLFLARPW